MTLPTLDIQLTREFYMRQRELYLGMVDLIEKLLDISPRTSELRREARAERYLAEISRDSLDTAQK